MSMHDTYRPFDLEGTWNLCALLPTTSLHVQIKALHEDQTLPGVQPFKVKAHMQARYLHQRDAARLPCVPLQPQNARRDANHSALILTLSLVRTDGSGQPHQPLGLRATHLALELLGVGRLHQPPAIGGQMASASPSLSVRLARSAGAT